ncbi:MAG TPA: SPFH domain-containing protein [Bacilli bacterium]
MGIFDFIKGQVIEVIEWTDASDNTMVYRFPVLNQQIKMGAQLTVRESQVAVFVNEGKVADLFLPGLHKLSTQNLPVMTSLKSWKYGFNSPFKAEVYFINMKPFTDQKWSTINPIVVPVSEPGVLRLRAFGIYSFRVADAEKFMMQIFGTNQIYDTEYIQGQLKSALVSGISGLLPESKIAALDLAGFYDELGTQAKDRIQHRFQTLGLEMASLIIENISLPEEVEGALDQKSKLNILGNLQEYAKLKTADAMIEAAKNPGGGLASADAEIAVGQVAAGTPKGAAGSSAEAAAEDPAVTLEIASIAPKKPRNRRSNVNKKVKCVQCDMKIARGSKFCPECGMAQVTIQLCTSCGGKLLEGTKFCAECGTKAE